MKPNVDTEPEEPQEETFDATELINAFDNAIAALEWMLGYRDDERITK